MNKVSLREAAGRQEQSERLTDAVLSFVEGIGVIKSYNLLGEKSEELTGNFKRSRNTSLAFERKMTPWTMGLNILYGIGIAAIFGLAVFLEWSGVFLWPMCWAFSCSSLTCSGRSRRFMARRPA